MAGAGPISTLVRAAMRRAPPDDASGLVDISNLLAGETPHSESEVTVAAACTRVDADTVYGQAVCDASSARRTRPPEAAVSTVVEGATVDVPGILEVVR